MRPTSPTSTRWRLRTCTRSTASRVTTSLCACPRLSLTRTRLPGFNLTPQVLSIRHEVTIHPDAATVDAASLAAPMQLDLPLSPLSLSPSPPGVLSAVSVYPLVPCV
jgi:hypothetical protein